MNRSSALLRRKKSGVSEIIGAILMLVLVVGLSTALFTFATDSVGVFGSNFTNLFSSSSNTFSERIVAEQITFNETANRGANVYVRSVGQLPVTIAAVYVTNQSAGNILFLSKQVSPSVQLNPGTFADIALSFTPDAGSVYTFTIATQGGNSVTMNGKA